MLTNLISDTMSPQPRTLRDVARYTEQHEHWTPNSKLRYSQVAFVKGSDATIEQKDQGDAAQVKSTPDCSPASHDNMNSGFNRSGHGLDGTGDIGESSSAFYVDTAGSSPVKTGLSNPAIRSPSPAPSDSSEEVIVFRGRNAVVSRD